MNQQENREIRISPDALIALVVAEAEDRELSAMPSLEEMNAAFHPSEEFQKKMDRLLKQAKRKQERKGAWRATKRLFVVATTVVTAFACILMPVQAVQEAVVCKTAEDPFLCRIPGSSAAGRSICWIF